VGKLLPEEDKRQVLGASSAGQRGASGLTLHVLERGPNEPWIVAVRNEGSESAHFVAVKRLLWFVVALPVE
jgi:hypothetical protein